MPLVEIGCFCGSSKAESNDVRLAGMNPSEWVILPGCGHFCHQMCFKAWTELQNIRHYDCPKCRASIDMVSMTLPSSRECPKPKKTRLRAVKVYFESDVKSDPASQMCGEGEVVEDDIEDGDEEEGGVDIGLRESGAGASTNEELVELRKQLREIRETLRTVKQERDQLLSDRKEFEALEKERDDLAQELHYAGDEIAQLTHENRQWELDQPELQQEHRDLEEMMKETEQQVEELELLNTSLEAIAKEREVRFEQLNTTWIEKEDGWRAEKSRMELQRKKLVDRINSEGSAGAVRIKELKASADAQEARILELNVKNDRLEITSLQVLVKSEATIAAAREESKAWVEDALLAQRCAERATKQAQDKARRIEAANANFQNKLQKQAATISNLQAQLATRRGILSSPEPTPPQSPLKRKVFLLDPDEPTTSSTSSRKFSRTNSFTIKQSKPLKSQSSHSEIIQISDDDDADDNFLSQENHDPRSLPLPTSIEGYNASPGVFGPRIKELAVLRSDQHIPDFMSGLIPNVGPKIKIKGRK